MARERIILHPNEVRQLHRGSLFYVVRAVDAPDRSGIMIYDFAGEHGPINSDPGGTIFGPGPYLKVPVRHKDDGWEWERRERVRCPWGYPPSRILLKGGSWRARGFDLKKVGLKRLHELTEHEMEFSGLEDDECLPTHYRTYGTDVGATRSEEWAYETLWASLYGQAAWDANPWVWVLHLRVFDNASE